MVHGVYMKQYGQKDKNGVELWPGQIIDIHQTVNGQNLFVLWWDPIDGMFYLKYLHGGRRYEYSVKSLFEPCEFSGEVDYEVVGTMPECHYCIQSYRDSENWYNLPAEKRNKFINCKDCIRAGGRLDPRIKD